MLFSALALSVLPLSSAFALPDRPHIRASLPAAFLLAGDSTTAIQSSGGGGWGNGFINKTLHEGAIGTNYGHDGATTVSFRSGGNWATVLARLSSLKSTYQVWVTIQVSH